LVAARLAVIPGVFQKEDRASVEILLIREVSPGTGSESGRCDDLLPAADFWLTFVSGSPTKRLSCGFALHYLLFSQKSQSLLRAMPITFLVWYWVSGRPGGQDGG
jgi:hypothetical protein